MKNNKFCLLILCLLMASFMTPSKAQWVEAYYNIGGFNNFYFVDSLHGWFTHYGEDKIIYTADGGHTFTVQQVTPGAYDMTSVFMEDLNNGWCGGGQGSGGPAKIHRTTNGGATWVLLSNPSPSPSSYYDIDKIGNTIWFVGGYGSSQGIIMKTSTNGASWQVNLYPQFGTIIDMYVLDEQNVLICGKKSIHRTSDGGNTWVEVAQNPIPDYWFTKMAFINDSLGYALGNDANYSLTKSYLYRTTDAGFTWHLHYLFADNGQKLALSVIPSTGAIFVAGYYNEIYKGIFKSMDGGATWDILPTNYLIHHIYTPTPYQGWAGAGAMIYRYDYVQPPVMQSIPPALIQLGQEFQYQAQATGMGLKYTMSGQPNGLNIGLYSGLIQGIPTQGGNFAITVAVKDTDANVVNTSFNLRVNRQPLFLPPFPPTQAWADSLYQFPLSVEDLDNDTVSFAWLAKPSWLTFLTEGITSVVISGVPTINDTGYHNISVLADDGYGGYDTLSWVLRVKQYTPNNPPFFMPPFPPTKAYVDSVYDYFIYAYDPDFEDSLQFYFLQKPAWLNMLESVQTAHIQGVPSVADTGYHPVAVVVADNRGGTDTLSWVLRVEVKNNEPIFVGNWPDTVVVYKDSSYAWSFLFQDIDNDTLFAIQGNIGVPGLQMLFGWGIGSLTAPVYGIVADTGWYTATITVKDEHGLYGSFQFTVYVDFVTSVEPLPGIPTEFALEQNYPNPFNPVTTIKFSVPQSGIVSLKVYNLLGQEIQTLVNEYLPIGTYKVRFDKQDLPSGVYIYELRTENFCDSKKLILLR